MDLTMVVILANLGAQFRYYLVHTDVDDRYNWTATQEAIGDAFMVFFGSFALLYSRWVNILGFDNFWG